MSAWRRIGIDKIPKYRELIEQSESIGMLWVDLWVRFVDAHRDPIDEMTIQGVYEFARWACEASGNDELTTSTCCHFYEHLPTVSLVRSKIPQYMSRQEILGLSEIFKYHLSENEYHELMKELLAVRH